MDMHYRKRCAYRFDRFRQSKFVSSHAIEFKSLIEPLNYVTVITPGLLPKVKEAIQIQGRATQFDEFVSRAIRIDDVQFYIGRRSQSPEPSRKRSFRKLEPDNQHDSFRIRVRRRII